VPDEPVYVLPQQVTLVNEKLSFLWECAILSHILFRLELLKFLVVL